MLRVVLGRLASAIPLLVLITLGTFCLSLLMPGDQAYAVAGANAKPERVEQVRSDLRLGDPPPVRYVRWLSDAVTGDLGVSATTRRPVSDEILRRLPITASLGLAALTLSLVIGLPLGLAQGVRPGSKLDKGLLGVVSLALAAPSFWVATMLVFLLSVQLGWLPTTGYESFAESPLGWARHLALPALTLALVGAGEIARQLRSGLVGVMQEDHIRAAEARGLSPARVLGKHALRNASLPVATIVGLRVGHLLAGSVIVEQIFDLHGLGEYTLTAVESQDLLVIQGVVLVTALIIILVNLVVDMAYYGLNPRVRIT